MQDIDILVNEESLEISKSLLVTGQICFRIGDQYFPEIRWNDSVVVLLSWWIEALAAVMTSNIGLSHEFLFMDGSFLVRGTKTGYDEISLDFLNRRTKDNKKSVASVVSIREFKGALLNASRKIDRYMEMNNWKSQEITKLKQVIKLLK